MIIYLKVKPNQRFDRIEKDGEGWQIRIKASPIDGKANDYLIGFLSGLLKIPKSKISLIKGQTSRFKCLEISADEKEVLQKMEAIINKSM